MRCRSLALFLAVACELPALAAEAVPPQPVAGKIRWVYDYNEGKRLAKETGKPLFVVVRCER